MHFGAYGARVVPGLTVRHDQARCTTFINGNDVQDEK
jgi:hypothetical protein